MRPGLKIRYFELGHHCFFTVFFYEKKKEEIGSLVTNYLTLSSFIVVKNLD